MKLKHFLPHFVPRFRPEADIFSIALCVAAAAVIIVTGSGSSIGRMDEFESGKVADRDIIAGHSVSYLDEEATRLRLDTIEKQIPAVYQLSADVSFQVLDSWNTFCDFTDTLVNRTPNAARLAVDAEYPADFSNITLDIYFSTPERTSFRKHGEILLEKILSRGIFSPHRDELTQYNGEIVELLSLTETGWRKDYISRSDIITAAGTNEQLTGIVKTMDAPNIFKAIAADLVKPFVRDNAFFSFSETQMRLFEAREQSPPVIRTIDKGKKIIRKGFVITEAEIKELNAYNYSTPGRDPRNIIGIVFLVILFYILFIIMRGKIILGRELSNNERYLLTTITGLYIIGSVLLRNLSPQFEGFPVSLAVPTSLLIMLLAVFMGTRPALVMALTLPLGTYLAGAFDFSSYIIALVSGATASTVLHKTESRMGIIKAGLIIAVANCIAVIIVLLIQGAGFNEYPAMLFWAALNGIISGMLTLGFLPPLEHALNAVTPFRLLELSDLNAPILRKLFTAAPGTYSHSLMVANLAEQACQDIGANALLARVGAYYHDIGKIANPDYFVENQGDHNRHDDIAPRLSATVIRSHVKLGVEKAHSLGLPKDVVAIIGEHHGNSIISWFYNKAAEQEEMVNSEDFSYPGNPPRSKESAVVMLADITEAAVRTLSKPTAGKMEKFIQQLFEAKVDHGQLAESELSFRDLETIKKAFVRVLAGYYHSRIEYPKQKEKEDEQSRG
ncbi:MAG: HDIG domain-containing protein [Treponema sp.]|nr:HDIG domain-containing protein [Treponema sp.]